MTRLDLPARPRILVITLRRLGDVLLTTPLIRSIRRGFREAVLDVLVFRGSDAILRGNPDIDNVMTMAEQPLDRRDARLGGQPVSPLRPCDGVHAAWRPADILRPARGDAVASAWYRDPGTRAPVGNAMPITSQLCPSPIPTGSRN